MLRCPFAPARCQRCYAKKPLVRATRGRRPHLQREQAHTSCQLVVVMVKGEIVEPDSPHIAPAVDEGRKGAAVATVVHHVAHDPVAVILALPI